MAYRAHSVLFGEYYAMICFGGKPNLVFAHMAAGTKAANLTNTGYHGGLNRSSGLPKTSISEQYR